MTHITPERLWNRNFVVWWFAVAQSSFGTSMSGIALAFLVLHQTGSAGLMGVNLALALLPGLLSPLAGTLVDRIALRLPLIAGNALRGVLMIGVGLMAVAGDVPLPLLYGLSLLMGLLGVLDGPAAGVLVPSLVPREHLARAMGLIATATQTMSLSGLLLGGVLVSRVGSGPSLLIDGVTFLVVAALLPFVRMPARCAATERRGFLADLSDGLSYVRRSPILTFLPLMALFINASFTPIFLLMPSRMLDMGAGAQGFALMEAIIAAGMAVGGALVSVIGGRFRPAPAISAGLGVVAAVMVGFAVSGTLTPILALSFALGLGLAATNTGLGVLTPSLVEHAYRGRVSGLIAMVSRVGMPLTLLLLAPVADRLSVGLIFAVSGVVIGLAALAWVWRSRTPHAAATAVAN